jgi:hypothetical protein
MHKTADTGSIFYIGRAAKSSRSGKFDRAHSISHRSKYWKRIANNHGFSVCILSTFENKEEADNEEKRLIALHGKRINGGVLCNLADGGQGNYGAPRTDEWVSKISIAHKGKKLSDEHKAKLSAARTGKRLSESHKKAISEASKRLKNFRLNDPDVRKKSIESRLKVKTKPRSKEHQDKINLANKGSKRSLESREKMSIAAKNRWRNYQKQ